jgi:hypothetical protein
MAAMQVPAELVQFFELGASLILGTCSLEGKPEGVRVFGVRLLEEGDRLAAFVPEAIAGSTFRNLRENPRVALAMVWPTKCEAYQAKGKVLEVRPLTQDEEAFQRVYRQRFSEELGRIGLNREAAAGMTLGPAKAVVFQVDSLYCQSPGLGAGGPYEGRRSPK